MGEIYKLKAFYNYLPFTIVIFGEGGFFCLFKLKDEGNCKVWIA